MKNNIKSKVLAIVTFILIVFLFFGKKAMREPQNLLIGTPPSIGTEEDPNARAEWEWMRLRDPSTGLVPNNIRARELAFATTVPRAETQSIRVTDWNSRGPINVGGRTRALAIDVTNENIILAGGVSGGMWRSTNAGQSWIKSTSPSQYHSVSCVVQDTRPGKTNIWYYGTGELWGNSAGIAGGGGTLYQGNGVFKSTDGGITWFPLSSTLTGGFSYVLRIAIDRSNLAQDELYAATGNELFRSTDGGLSWQASGINTNQQTYYDIVVTSTGVVYTVDSFVPQHVWRSPDGLIWTDITPEDFFPSWTYRVVLALAPSNENILYTLSARGYQPQENDLWKYTYISGNGSGSGGMWENRTNNVPATFFTQLAYAHTIKVKPDDENTVFIGDVRLFRSTDGFATNTNTTEIAYTLSPYGHGDWADHHELSFLPSNPNVMLTASDGGVYKTNNNMASEVVFDSLNNGYITSQFYAVAIDHSTINNNIVIGGMQDTGIWFTNSIGLADPWVPITYTDGGFIAISTGRSYYYLSQQYGYIWRRVIDDNGTVLPGFARINPTAPPGGYLWIHPFVLDNNNTNIMYLPKGDRIWRNSDLSAIPNSEMDTTTSINWSELTNTAIGDENAITALCVSHIPANRLYYANSLGKIFRLDNANIGNPIPQDIWTGQGLPAAYASCIAVDPTNADNVMLIFANYGVISVYHSSNGGTSWAPVAGNLEQYPDGSGDGPSCRWSVIVPGTGTTYYFVGTSTGLYSTETLDGMSTVWAQEGANTIGNVVVDMVDARVADGLVVVATHGQGVFSGYVAHPLPIELYYFTGTIISNGNVRLNWGTLSEVNNYGFEVQKSEDRNQESEWKDIGFIRGYGNSNSPKDYSFIDENVIAGKYSYRLKQLDTDGKFEYSKVIEVDLSSPEKFELYQNYPNPFNPITIIKFSIPQSSFVSLKIFTSLGEEVETLAAEELSAGSYKYEWDAKGLTSGIYLYQLKSGNYIETNKMILLK